MVMNPYLDEYYDKDLKEPSEHEYIIRDAKRSDIPALARLEELCFRRPWTEAQLDSEMKKTNLSSFILAEIIHQEERYLLAYMSWWQIIDEAQILNVSVHPSWRRQGIARVLVQTAMTRMEENGVREVTLEVAKHKRGAQLLYEEAGFTVVGMIKDYYPEYADDALIMKRSF